MLHKKFKSSKCKTALNLAKSRLKLLRNKKDIQVKQLRREIGQLLQTGQDQTARIRVEHVVREENTKAAFELIEIYCELLVARLPVLESQKDCPNDLKEAVTSLIFAAPRCGDIPELQDVRKHLTTKYGKEFVAAATELRPNCGVSRNLVEKLSVKAPDGPTKVKILTAIAEEQNIKWEPKWFEDENPAPSVEIPQKEQHTEKDEKIQMKPLDHRIDDNLHHVHAHPAGRLKVSSQSHPPASIDVNEALPPTSYPDGRHGDFSNRKAPNHSLGIAKSSTEERRPTWTMEFKDATAAAQAAAESAERASMAARAAAELSRQSNFVGESSSTGSFNQRNPRVHVDHVGTNQHSNMAKGSDATSPMKNAPEPEYDVFESPKKTRVDEVVHEEAEKFEVHSSSFEHRSGSFGDAYGIFSNSNERYDTNHSDDKYDLFAKNVMEDDNQGYSMYRDEREGGQISGSDEQKYGLNWGNNIFVDMKDDINDMNDRKETGTRTYSVPVFDEPGSFDDDDINDMNDRKETRAHTYSVPVFDEPGSFDYDDDGIDDMNDRKETGAHTDRVAVFDDSDSSDYESMLNPAEKSYKSPVRDFAVHKDGFGLDVSESFRKSPLFAKLSEPVPLKFDSDGESSGSEKELQNETHNNDLQSLKTSYEEGPISSREEPLGLDHNSDYKPSSESKNDMTRTDSEDGMELNFGSLPSLRSNMRMREPPYRRGPVSDVSTSNDSQIEVTSKSPKMATNETSARTWKDPTGYFNPYESSSEDDTSTPKQQPATVRNTHGLSRRTKGPVTRPVPTRQHIRDSSSSAKEVSSKQTQKWDESHTTRLDDPQSKVSDTAYTSSLQRASDSNEKAPSRESSTKKTGHVHPKLPDFDTEYTSSLPKNEKAPSRESSTKKTGHVHPKLPDFDSLTAHMQSLRTNRQK